MNAIRKCKGCENKLEWHSKVLNVEDVVYCMSCVDLAPVKCAIFIGGEFYGETEDVDGIEAWEIFGELLED